METASGVKLDFNKTEIAFYCVTALCFTAFNALSSWIICRYPSLKVNVCIHKREFIAIELPIRTVFY